MAENNSNKKSIYLIHPDCSSESRGGSQTNTLEISKHLLSFFDVKIVTAFYIPSYGIKVAATPRSKVEKYITKLGLKGLAERIFGNPYQFFESKLSFIPIIIKLLRDKPSLVYPNNGYGGLAIARFYRLLTGTRFIYTEHAGMLHGMRTLKRNLKYKPDLLIVFSDETKEKVLALEPQQKVTVIPNGVDLSIFTPHGSCEKGLFDNGLPTILCVATLNRGNHKRVELLINAMTHLKDHANLLLCGTGKDTAYFESLCKHRLPNNSKIITRSFEQMPALYRSVDLFTLPSEEEPFGRVYVEAMASGLGVVATRDKMREYLIGDAGVLCDVNNECEYSLALKSALSKNWTQKAIGQSTLFDWRSVSKEYSKVIYEVLDADKPASN